MTFLIGKLMINWWTCGLCIAIVCNKPVLKQTDLTILVIHWAVASRHSNVASVQRNLSNVQNPLCPIRCSICPHISPYYGRNPAPVDRSFILGFQPSRCCRISSIHNMYHWAVSTFLFAMPNWGDTKISSARTRPASGHSAKNASMIQEGTT